jgi:hypothetical protein
LGKLEKESDGAPMGKKVRILGGLWREVDGGASYEVS